MSVTTRALTGSVPLGPDGPPRPWRVRVVAGPHTGAEVIVDGAAVAIGTAEGVALRVLDPTVSRYHLELRATARGLSFRDLGSTNGTFLATGGGDVEVERGTATGKVEIGIGKTRLLLAPEDAGAPAATAPPLVAPLPVTSFGGLIGASAAMQEVFGTLRDAAPTSAPVLITGESGTGKELTARAVHDASPRAGRPFEVVDCGGLPPTLIESELFGHERGSFTGASAQREGAFERAEGGTIFLDELGELPLELQPKLLRVLAEREIRRIGASRPRRVDVRVVAATNRDLRQRVNAGAFRADLFFRLAVIQIRLPPLRERLEDLPLLVRGLLDAIARDRQLEVPFEPDDDLFDALASHAWPGNVRELRNYLEQLVILRKRPALGEEAPAADLAAAVSPFHALEDLPMRTAKEQLLERFERYYIGHALERARGNVAEAARLSGVDRGTLFRAIRRYGLGT